MIRTLIAALALLLAPAPAAAFWEYGHETVARIAWANVKPSTRTALRRLLVASPLLETPTCPANTMASASVWADCVKPLGERFSYASSWHYQNVDVCRPFDLKSACRDGNCVSAQITRDVKLLGDAKVPLRERMQALVFLIHFVGDLHQPLHAGDRGDLGGNRVKMRYGPVAGRTNLHGIWDGYLAERAISTPQSLIRSYAAAERASLAAGSVEDWSRESWAVSRDVAYAGALGGDPCSPVPERAALDEPAIKAAIPAARDLVTKGGLRLARLLDEALG